MGILTKLTPRSYPASTHWVRFYVTGQMSDCSFNDHNAAPSHRPLVLLVEDEQSIAEPFANALDRSGFRTTVARHRRPRLRGWLSSRPDIVLLDLSLPDGDGRDICRQLRGESDVPIIMVTASGSVTDRVVGLELGADDYMVKPFAVGEVVARIRAVLRRGRAGSGDPTRSTSASCDSTLAHAASGWRTGSSS